VYDAVAGERRPELERTARIGDVDGDELSDRNVGAAASVVDDVAGIARLRNDDARRGDVQEHPDIPIAERKFDLRDLGERCRFTDVVTRDERARAGSVDPDDVQDVSDDATVLEITRKRLRPEHLRRGRARDVDDVDLRGHAAWSVPPAVPVVPAAIDVVDVARQDVRGRALEIDLAGELGGMNGGEELRARDVRDVDNLEAALRAQDVEGVVHELVDIGLLDGPAGAISGAAAAAAGAGAGMKP
jgi:hypothetical protein